ncbi:N-acetylgalactosaminide alpha-2,6-sialyltransferase (sialyltransferase 7C) [Sarotherodon galilaeus]
MTLSTITSKIIFKNKLIQTTLLIKLRGENDHLFTGVKNSATVAWRTILEKMGLQGAFTPLQARKKWDNLKAKYKDCKYPGSGEGVSGKPTAATWPWFSLMDKVIGQRPSIRPPVLLSTLPEDTPGPSSAVGDQNLAESDTNEEDSQPPTTGRKRKRDRDDELLNLIREDMQQQREAEERGVQESRERRIDFFLILERSIPK